MRARLSVRPRETSVRMTATAIYPRPRARQAGARSWVIVPGMQPGSDDKWSQDISCQKEAGTDALNCSFKAPVLMLDHNVSVISDAI